MPRLHTRLQRLEQHFGLAYAAESEPTTYLYVPYNARDPRPPGCYREYGALNVVVIYEPANADSPLHPDRSEGIAAQPVLRI